MNDETYTFVPVLEQAGAEALRLDLQVTSLLTPHFNQDIEARLEGGEQGLPRISHVFELLRRDDFVTGKFDYLHVAV